MPARKIPPSDELTHRIKAAARYGGFTSVQDFVDEVGMGRTTIYAVFQGKRDLKEMEWERMILVAKLPEDWFEDLSRDKPAKEATSPKEKRPKMPPRRSTPQGKSEPRKRASS